MNAQKRVAQVNEMSRDSPSLGLNDHLHWTENCIVIAEGAMQLDGAFHAAALGFPPCEPREGLPMAAQRLNFFGGPPLSCEDEASLMGEELDVVILSDVHLDRSEVLNGLKTIFDGEREMHACGQQ